MRKLTDGPTYAIYPYTSSASWLEYMESHEGISTVIGISEDSP